MASNSNILMGDKTMQNLLAKWGVASFLGVCLVGSFAHAAQANTGSAITGDGGGGNIDSTTFGSFFTPPIPEMPASTGINAFAATGLPPNWKCLSRPVCPDCDLRLETLAKMLNTNLSGTLTQQVIQGSAPRFCCDPDVARAIAFEALALSSSSVTRSGEAFQMTSSGSGAALLDGVQPASLSGQFPVYASAIVAQADVPAPSRRGNELIAAANTSDSATQLQQQLEQALNFQSDPIDPAKSQSIKLQSLRALVTTIQGLVWEENLSDKTQRINVDVEQLAAAIKSYNDLVRLMSVQELNAWRGDRNGQDITTVLKQLREGVTVL
jgi:hypothetical protein